MLASVLSACALVSATSSPSTAGISGTYDFYFPSVKKGTAGFDLTAGRLRLSSAPGFAPASEASLTFEGNRPASAVFQPEGKAAISYTFDSHGMVSVAGKKGHLFSPTHPSLLRYVLDGYDRSKRGFQKFTGIDFAKGTPREIQAELYRTQPRTVNGHTHTLREWRIETPPNAEAVVWTDESNLPLYWWIPAVNFEIVLRGYEELRPSYKYETSVSPPRYQALVEKNVWIPTRDGVRLQADVYRPKQDGRFPVILQRTCYDRSEFGNADGEFFAQRGYVYVTQHVRGRGGSEGSFEIGIHEAADGYDTVRWCATQPWSAGRVAMMGASYNGYCAWMAAKTQPKWLKTIISVVPMPSSPYGAPWDQGTFYISDQLGWWGLLRDKEKVQVYNADITKAMNTLPISKSDEVQYGHHVPAYGAPMHDRMDDYITQTSYRSDIKKIDLPVMYLSGWFDTVGIGTKLNYMQMVANGRKNQKLIWGPWNHFTNRESTVGVTDFGPDGYIDMRTATLRWFDRWLKGMPNGIDKEPSVAAFMVGENRWHYANRWPLPGVHPQRLYLHASKSLSKQRPVAGPPSRYTYDPATYVYTNSEGSGYFFQKGDNADYLLKRKDQLFFDSGPLKKALQLNGPIRGRLYAASDAKDTDWVMVLIDQRPNGLSVPLATGFSRARYRKSFTHPEMLRPGEIYAYDLDLWETGISIPAGHRLRIVVCSTLFPDKDRNLNTGEPVKNATRMVAAHQKIYHDSKRPSYIELPVLGTA